MNTTGEHVGAVVVGAGQGGLATSYWLSRAGLEHIVLDRHPRVGDTWRHRWPSLRLFTPARIDGLPGMAFPSPAVAHPGKDDMASYLERYTERFHLPVRSGVTVQRVDRDPRGFRLQTSAGTLSADQLIVATGANQKPKIPDFARRLSPAITQLTTVSYRGTADLAPGPVLVVGAGNSGSEIALEVSAAGRRVFLSGRDTGQGNPRFFGRLPWWFGTHFLTTSTPFGRRMAARMAAGGAPRFWITQADFDAAGVERVRRTTGVEGGMPRLDDGTVLEVETVIWCAGFTQDFSWIVPAITDQSGHVLHDRGVSRVQPGLYFMGLPFLRSIASTLVGGAGADARHIVAEVRRRRNLGIK